MQKAVNYWDKIIQHFISENASSRVIARAALINPNLYKQEKINDIDYECLYHCTGSDGAIYQIEVCISDNAIDETFCDCPYTYGGLCKHEVAVLNQLKKDILRGRINLSENIGAKESKFTKDTLILTNGVINKFVISKVIPFVERKFEFVFGVKVEYIDRTNIKCKIEAYRVYKVELTYLPEEDKLHINCDCHNKSEYPCIHTLKAIEYIIDTFGENYFSKDYLNKFIENYIKSYGLTLEDDYNKIFDFAIKPTGVQVKEKIKNLMTQEGILAFKNRLTKEEEVALNYAQIEESQFGVGFVQVKEREFEFATLIPIWAKYDKFKTELKSNFIELQVNNRIRNFSDLKDEEQVLILNACNLKRAMHDFRENMDKVRLSRYLSLQNKILKGIKYQNVFQLNDKYKNQNLVRKNMTALEVDTNAKILLSFTLTKKDNFLRLKAHLSINENQFPLSSPHWIIGLGFVVYENKFYVIEDETLMLDILRFNKDSEVSFFNKDTALFYENILQPISKNYEIKSPIIKKNKESVDSTLIEKQVYIRDAASGLIELIPAIQYPNNNLLRLTSPAQLYQIDDKMNIQYQDRNAELEDEFLELFCSLHHDFDIEQDHFYLEPEALMKDYWLINTSEKLKRNHIKLLGINELKSFKFNVNKAKIAVKLNSGIDWFEVNFDISFGNQKASLKSIQKAFLKKSNYVELDDGTLGLLPEEWMKKFENYFKVAEVKKDTLQISNYQFGIIDELYNELEERPDFLINLYETKLRLQKLEEHADFIKLPKGIKATLRPYQEYGFNWMFFLHKNKLGGCLADDMGLGKTLQTITFLQYLKLVEKSKTSSLIIAPTSLVFNWNNEIEKFCPTLKTLSYIGSERNDMLAQFKKNDIVITTYGTMLNDIEILKDIEFNYIILDESQAIKNPHSKRYKAVRLLKSFNRLVLTGTPIENNTFDLYAQFNFLNPGLLGNMAHFKTNFSDAIDKDKDVKTSELLSKIVHPFLLRRTKENVALDLPEKTESVIYCDMPEPQRKVYDTFKEKYRDYILNKIDDEGIANSQMYIIEGLMKLRQICNATSILSDEEDYGDFSIKLDMLFQIIKEKTGNHKILIFSQFVKMLQLVKSRLEEAGIKFEYLDGQTRKRQENVQNFQENKDVRVFLISLKAGGTGLNLTEADYVFIIDPWWNPAVENQAIDRCYRIGQKKNVMAYRMICRDTIEEKIVNLQQKKKSIANSIIKVDGEKKSFNVNEVKELFM